MNDPQSMLDLRITCLTATQLPKPLAMTAAPVGAPTDGQSWPLERNLA